MANHNLLRLAVFFLCLLGLSSAYPQTAPTGIAKILEDKATAAFKFKADILGNFVRGVEKQALSLADNDFTRRYARKYDEADRANLTVLFHAVSAANADYMQVRFLDKDGIERIRVDRRKGEDIPFVVPVEAMQDKSGKTYFTAVKDIQAGDAWHSNVNLNMERGAIEQPIRPTFRVSTPVYSKDGFRGVVVINLIMDRILNLLTYSSDFDIAMVDRDEEIIAHPNPEKAWSRYLPDRGNLKDELSGGDYQGVEPYIFPLAEIFRNDDQASLVLIPKQSLISNIRSSMAEQITVELTAEEKTWLAEHPVIRVAPDPDYPPMEFFDKQGNYLGLASDFMHLVADRLGVRIEAIKKENWTAALDALRNGEADMIAANTPTEEFLKEFLFTDTYYEFYDAIITHEGIEGMLQLEDLGGKEVLVAEGWPEVHILKSQYPDIKVVEVESTLDAVTRVALKEYDYAFAYFPTATHFIHKQALPGLRVAGIVGEPIGDAATFRKDSEMLRDIINKALTTITDEERKTLKNRWLPGLSALEYQQKLKQIELTREERAWIKAHPEIRYIALRDWPPIDYQDANGAHTGITADIISLAADRVGLNLKAEFGPWAEMLDKLLAGNIDLAPEIYHTEERARHLAYSKPYLPLYDAIFALPKSGIQSPVDLIGKTITVEKGYAMEEILRKEHSEENLLVVESTLHALQAVATGNADAYIGSQYVASYLIDKNLIHGVQAVTILSDTPQYLYLAVPKDREILRDILEKGLDSISGQEIQAIIRKYVSYVEPKKAKFIDKLSQEEKSWLKAHPVIRVHNEQNWAPFNFYDNDQPKGYSIDYMNLLAQRLGIEVSYITGPSWGEFLDMIKTKELDVMLNIVNTEERRKYINFTDSYLHSLTGIYVKADAPPITSLKELEGNTVSIPKGFFEQELLERYYPKVNLHLVRNNQEALEAVIFGKADAALGETAVTNFLTMKHSLTGLRLSGKVSDERFDNILNIGVRKDWPILQGLLQKAMDSVTEGEEQLIKKKWVVRDKSDKDSQIEFTAEEKAWLASNPVVKLGYDIDWPPVEYADEDGHYHGMSADYMALIGKNLGLTIEPILPQEWKKTMEDIKARRIDIISAIVHLPEREAYLNFTKPYLSFPMVIVTNQDVSYVGSLEELKGKKVAVVSGFASHDLLKKDHPELALYPTKNVVAGLKAVQNNDAYAFVGSLATISQVLSREKIVGLKVSGETPYSYDITIGVRNDQPILAGLIQKALDAIPEEQRNEIYNRWVAVSYERGIDYTLLWQVLLVTTLIIILIVYWNRQLKRVVNLKTAELRDVLESLEVKVKERTADLDKSLKVQEQQNIQLSESEERTRLLLESVGEGVFGVDPEGRITFANPKATELLGYSVEEMLGVHSHDLLHHHHKDGSGYPAEECPMFKSLASGEVHRVDNEVYWRKDGTYFEVEYNSTPIRKNGDVIGAVLVFTDITERKEAERKIAESEERTRLLLESVGEGVFGVNTKGEIVFANPQCSTLLGYTEQELLGNRAHPLFHHTRANGSEYPVQECWMFKSFTEGKAYRVDDEVLWRKDGTSFPVEYNSTPIFRGEELIGSVISFNDISERLAAQQERDTALEVISGSIAYATNIQHAILPPKTCLDVISSDHFVHWEPRDRVGGDMYWCKSWGLGKLLALGDCTGHGVPGAFMTMIANGALEMVVMETMPGDTGTLLQRSHQIIQQELNQDLQEGNSDDGLELGVCYIDRKRKKMNYSGARFSLFHVDNGVVTEIKGDKKGIGYRGIPRDVPFTTHEVELIASGTFYMTSDGLTDQIGGDKRRGFGKRRFKDLLCDIESLPMEEQRARIERALVEYQGEEKRRDDVSVIGFRI